MIEVRQDYAWLDKNLAETLAYYSNLRGFAVVVLDRQTYEKTK